MPRRSLSSQPETYYEYGIFNLEKDKFDPVNEAWLWEDPLRVGWNESEIDRYIERINKVRREEKTENELLGTPPGYKYRGEVGKKRRTVIVGIWIIPIDKGELSELEAKAPLDSESSDAKPEQT